ncbi:MAG: YdcF family protein [Kocuria sp.]|nr:YdcF family protein [Kocuria sp.]
MHYLVGLLALTVSTLLMWIAIRRIQADARRFSNAAWIAAGITCLLVGLTVLGVGTFLSVVILLAVIAPVLVLLLSTLLLYNGFIMLRREGRSLGNLLSLLAGFGLLLALSLGFGLLFLDPQWLPLSLWIALSCGWVAALFFSFLSYSWLYQRLLRIKQPAFIITLGSGLVCSRVPPLLRNRIDLALQLAEGLTASGTAPLLVMSGGQGPDEARSEADAMGAYALEHGAHEETLLLETKSETTEQNLRYSRSLVRGRLGLTEEEALPEGIAVTSNYHAMRAAIVAHRIGVSVDVVGAPTAAYFWPSAVLREFVAVVRGALIWHAIGYLLVTTTLPAIFAAVMWGR